MNDNNSNNLYDLESERRRLEERRKREKKDRKRSGGGQLKSKIALYGQVAFFLVMVGLLMFQCGGH